MTEMHVFDTYNKELEQGASQYLCYWLPHLGAFAKFLTYIQRLQLCNCAVCLLAACSAQGKFKPLKFTCKHRQLLLTDLFQCMAAAAAVSRCIVAAKVLGWVARPDICCDDTLVRKTRAV